jgi:hypothetical protein
VQLTGSRGQQQIDDLYDSSGTITAGGTAQLVLPQRKSCSLLLLENISTVDMTFQIGVQPAVATLTNGVVTSITVNDVGFGFQLPPEVVAYGGGNSNDPSTKGGTLFGWPSPNNPAVLRAVMTTSLLGGLQISSIEIDNGGSGYIAPPFIYIRPDRRDPTGVGLPSATVGLLLKAGGGQASYDATMCPTTAVSAFCATTGSAYTCKWAP